MGQPIFQGLDVKSPQIRPRPATGSPRFEALRDRRGGTAIPHFQPIIGTFACDGFARGESMNGTTMRVVIQNDPVFLDLIPHFLGIATHDNIDAPPADHRIAVHSDRRGPSPRLDRAVKPRPSGLALRSLSCHPSGQAT